MVVDQLAEAVHLYVIVVGGLLVEEVDVDLHVAGCLHVDCRCMDVAGGLLVKDVLLHDLS